MRWICRFIGHKTRLRYSGDRSDWYAVCKRCGESEEPPEGTALA